jgi:YidC/Oxa1 family membrane protein insertase
MDKRTLVAVAICMGILLLWWKIFPPTPPQAPPPQAQSAPAAQQQPAPGQPASAPATGPPAAAAPTPGAPAAPTPATRGPEERVVLRAPGARFVLSSWGGTLREVQLEEPRFLRDPKDPSSGMQIIGTTAPEQAPLRTTFSKADFASPEAGTWTVERPDATSVVFRAENAQVALEKRYKVEGPYRLSLELTVHNRGSAPVSGSLALHLHGKQDPAKQAGGFWDIAEANVAGLVCLVDDKVQRSAVEPLVKEPKEYGGNVRWAAADDKYFAVAAVPQPGQAEQRVCSQRAIDHLTAELVLGYPSRSVPVGGKTSYPLTVFAGPKYIDQLRQVKPAGVDVELDRVVDVTFAVLSRPLLYLLKVFHGWVGNWGLAIIMLTLFVKLLTFYPTQRAMMSGKKMQRLAPKMQALRKKFENDRQRLGMETMNLYKQEGVSPLGGCLPTLITMPIWIALFSTLNYSVELHRAPFIGYIRDLSIRDPYFITPLLMGGIMFLQMRMSPAGADPQQQKMMAIMMPIMFTAFSLFLPAGLALYTLTNSLLAIAQQLLVNHLDKKMSRATA